MEKKYICSEKIDGKEVKQVLWQVIRTCSALNTNTPFPCPKRAGGIEHLNLGTINDQVIMHQKLPLDWLTSRAFSQQLLGILISSSSHVRPSYRNLIQ